MKAFNLIVKLNVKAAKFAPVGKPEFRRINGTYFDFGGAPPTKKFGF